ncbi:MAG: glycoside hydrolase family 2 protein [Polyangiaceae bacterium]
MARIRAATNYEVEPIEGGWELAELSSAAGPLPTSPAEVEARGASLSWSSATCPGTVASALRTAKRWDFTSTQNFDASDWWYRARFSSTPCADGEALWLELDGLATLADVWLNGTHVLRSENMFCAHELCVSALLRAENELLIRFSSLDTASGTRRPRPRFKTRLIERQQLRWFRTTLLGRIPGWAPPVAAVGPWRAVRVVRKRAFAVQRAVVQARVEQGRALVRAEVEAELLGAQVESATLHVGSSSCALTRTEHGALTLEAELEIPNAERWWPHSHGAQPRYAARITLKTSAGNHELTFDAVAFRSIRVDTTGDRFAVLVNDVEIRCRGACWTPTDVVSLNDEMTTLTTIRQAHAAGMNMLRVGGTMVYESDTFYEECDRLGILVWQDFMFANCDYPGDDEAFRASVTREAEQFLERTEPRACLAVLCGNSEIEQQIAMLGLPREAWHPALFQDLLRGLCHARRADVPYVASTPTSSGTALPFQPDTGLTHYYGVGAYLRPLSDARRADVKFTPECLGFSNIPEDATVELVLGDARAPFHDPRWKARVPRDSGPGWDFDDVRDHYTKLLFGVDPIALRYEDPERALALGRVTTGEVMARTISEWRREASNCRGALIWFLRDLWPGAGWGVIDAQGLPKAAYYFVKRAMQQQALFFSDEGLNGLIMHVINDAPAPLAARLELHLIRNGAVQVAVGHADLQIAARGSRAVNSASLFEHFIDLTRAYRFGPSQYDVAVALLRHTETSEVIAESCYFPSGLPPEKQEDLGLEAVIEQIAADAWQLRMKSQRFAYAVSVDLPGFTLDDSYFQLVPGRERTVAVRATTAAAKPRGSVRPLNARSPTRISVLANEGTAT